MKKIITFVLVGLLAFAICSAPTSEKVHGLIEAGGTTTEYVRYARKIDNTKAFEGALPLYEHSSNTSCGPVAGAIVLGYYDRLYPELISNFESSFLRDGKVNYRLGEKNVDNCIEELIVAMKAQSGATSGNIKKGLSAYVSSKGYSTSINSCMNNYILFSTFSYSKYKAEIDADRPVILCCDTFNLTAITPATDQAADYQTYIVRELNHAVVGFGYRTIDYTCYETRNVWSPVWYNPFRTIVVTEEVVYRSDTFLMVSTGTGSIGFMNINQNFKIIDAFGIGISK